MTKKTPKISGKDFTEACLRFMRDPAVDAGIVKPSPPLPPPSPAVLEIMQGLQEGWNANKSLRKPFIEITTQDPVVATMISKSG